MNRLFVFLVGFMLLSSCQQVGKESTTKQVKNLDNDESESVARLKEMYHRFPSVDEMLTSINKNKKEFSTNLVNSAAKSDEYLDSKSQALNLGVYSADLAYLTIHGKHTEAMVYFEALYELSDKLRISAAFNRNLLRRIQDNITNADSLQNISEQAINNLSEYLETNRNEKVFILLSVGGFVEALYLSVNLLSDFDSEAELVQKIADQKFVLDNITAYASYYESDPTIESILLDLEPLIKLYANLSVEATETSVNQNSDGKLVIGGGDKLVITKKEFDELVQVTTELRTKIVEF